jgi:thiopurine S-methyltransferase
MDPEFWHERWTRGEIGFHQQDFNAHMQKFMASLGLASGANVLVPLCGKTRDMLWLVAQGFRVTGIEINPRAVVDFFAESGLVAEVESCTDSSRYRSGDIEIWRADFLRLDPSRLPQADAVYDRAALVALPPKMRKAYASQLKPMIPPGAPMLLLTLDYPEAEMQGPPFPVSSDEVFELFGDEFEVEQVLSENCLEREHRFREKGVTRMTESVHILRKNS